MRAWLRFAGREVDKLVASSTVHLDGQFLARMACGQCITLPLPLEAVMGPSQFESHTLSGGLGGQARGQLGHGAYSCT